LVVIKVSLTAQAVGSFGTCELTPEAGIGTYLQDGPAELRACGAKKTSKTSQGGRERERERARQREVLVC